MWIQPESFPRDKKTHQSPPTEPEAHEDPRKFPLVQAGSGHSPDFSQPPR